MGGNCPRMCCTSVPKDVFDKKLEADKDKAKNKKASIEKGKDNADAIVEHLSKMSEDEKSKFEK